MYHENAITEELLMMCKEGADCVFKRYKRCLNRETRVMGSVPVTNQYVYRT